LQLKVYLDKEYHYKFTDKYQQKAKNLTQSYVDKYVKHQRDLENIDYTSPQKAEKEILNLIFKSQKEGKTKVFVENFFLFLKNEIGISDISNCISSPYKITLYLRDFFFQDNNYSEILEKINLQHNSIDLSEESMEGDLLEIFFIFFIIFLF
jgi:hypothetical protein